MTENRVRCYDSLKFFAAFIVYTTHFISTYDKDFFYPWDNLPYSLILGGISGKFAVALFGVLLSYFAYQAGAKQNDSLVRYSLKRYFYFALCGLFINAFYKVSDIRTNGCVTFFDIAQWLKVSFCIGDEIFPTFWCMNIFLLASILSYICGRYQFSIIANITLIGVLLFSYNLWAAICLLGTLLPFILAHKNKWSHITYRLLLFAILFILIKRDESNFTYFIDGICSVILIMLSSADSILHNILENKFTASIGRMSMAIFILHPIIYTHLAPILFRLMEKTNYTLSFLLTWVLCFIAIVLISCPVTYALNFTAKKINKQIDKSIR